MPSGTVAGQNFIPSMIPPLNTMATSQSKLAETLVRHDAKQFFLDNCDEIYEKWTSLLRSTTLPADATSSDQRVAEAITTLDGVIRNPSSPYTTRLAYIQLARVLSTLKQKVKEDRRRGTIIGKRSHRDASIVIDIFSEVTGSTRDDVHSLFRIANRCAVLGRNSLLLLVFSEQDEKVL